MDSPSKKDLIAKGTSLSIGIAVGVAIGVATDNLGLWLALGVALGLSAPALFRTAKPGDKEK